MIPDSQAFYTLVSLSHHRGKTDHEPGSLSTWPATGHFHSFLRPIGGSQVLAYDGIANSGIISPATTLHTKEFNGDRSSRRSAHAHAAVYYLVGGQAAQDALYRQRVEYLLLHYGLAISDAVTDSSGWPTTISLHPMLSDTGFSRRWQPRNPNHCVSDERSTLNHRVELEQGYLDPRACLSRRLPKNSRSEWKYYADDPTESFSAGPDAPTMRLIASEHFTAVEATVDLVGNEPKVSLDLQVAHLMRSDLWGDIIDEDDIKPLKQRRLSFEGSDTDWEEDAGDPASIRWNIAGKITLCVKILLLRTDSVLIKDVTLSPTKTRIKKTKLTHMQSFTAKRTHWVKKDSGDPWVLGIPATTEKLEVGSKTASNHLLGVGGLKKAFFVSMLCPNRLTSTILCNLL